LGASRTPISSRIVADRALDHMTLVVLLASAGLHLAGIVFRPAFEDGSFGRLLLLATFVLGVATCYLIGPRGLAGVLLALEALWGCGSPIPSGDRVVDGLWIKQETRCPDPSSGACGAPCPPRAA